MESKSVVWEELMFAGWVDTFHTGLHGQARRWVRHTL